MFKKNWSFVCIELWSLPISRSATTPGDRWPLKNPVKIRRKTNKLRKRHNTSDTRYCKFGTLHKSNFLQPLFFLFSSLHLNQQILDEKVNVKAKSKIGSLDNVKHRPGGGDKKVFNDVEYLRQMSETTSSAGTQGNSRNSSRRQSTSQVLKTFRKKFRKKYML